MLNSNFYSGLVTEEAVVRGVQFSAQNGGGWIFRPARGGGGRLCRLAADGAKVWKDVVGSATAAAQTAAAFRTRGGAVGPPGGRGAFTSPALLRGQCGILGAQRAGPGPPPGPRGLSCLIRPHPP
jgi:hypothetical protein